MQEPELREAKVEAGTPLLLSYFAFDEIAEFQHSAKCLKDACEDIVQLPVYTFGRTDFLIITFATTDSLLNKARQEFLHREGVGKVSQLSVHHATVITTHPNVFDPVEEIKSHQVVGVVTVKIKDAAWDRIYGNVQDFAAVRDVLTKFFQKVINKTVKQHGWSIDDVRGTLALSYGAEDIQIVILCKSIQYVKQFVSLFRELTLKDLIEDDNETDLSTRAVKSSETILGMYWPFDTVDEALNSNLELSHDGERTLTWTCQMQTLPGHMQAARNAIQKQADEIIKGGEFSISPIVGRNDLVFTRTFLYEKGSCGLFLEYLKYIKSLFSCRSILSFETAMSFPKLHKVESTVLPQLEDEAENDFLSSLKQKVQESKHLDLFERDSFFAILNRLRAMYNAPYGGNCLSTLVNLVGSGIERYIEWSPERKSGNRSLSLWISHVELSFTSRYSGSPPVAETAVLGYASRCASSQKFLVLLDYVALIIIKDLTDHLGVEKIRRMEVITNNQQGFGAACFREKDLGNAFIALPSTCGFHQKIAMYQYIHELGHVIHDCLIASKYYSIKMANASAKHYADSLENTGSDGIEIQKKFAGVLLDETDISEAFAEFFAAHIISGGDFEKHKEVISSVFDELTQDAPENRAVYIGIKNDHVELAKTLRDEPDKIKPYQEVVNEMMVDIQSWELPLMAKIQGLFRNDFSSNTFWDIWIETKKNVSKM